MLGASRIRWAAQAPSDQARTTAHASWLESCITPTRLGMHSLVFQSLHRAPSSNLHDCRYRLAAVLASPSDLQADLVETAEQHLEASSSRDTSGLIW